MMIRALHQNDFDQLKEIHEKYYKEEFDFPDFYDKFLCAFVVVENDQIISAGGIRTILESVIVTNKDVSARRRRAALMEVLQASTYFANKYDYHELHAFVQDNNWANHLIEKGFKPTVGKALVIQI